jgi:hypothetical protein
MRGKSPSHLRRMALGMNSSLFHGAPHFQACGGMIARASGHFTFQKMLIGVHIQHALELAHHVDIQRVEHYLLRGWLDRRQVGDDGGHFLRCAAPTNAAEQLDYCHHCLATWPENKKARIA